MDILLLHWKNQITVQYFIRMIYNQNCSVQWLSIMVQLCHLEKYCIWQYAPELPRAVVALFLGRPLSSLVYHRISELFYQIDHERAESYSIVELIFQYIGLYISIRIFNL